MKPKNYLVPILTAVAFLLAFSSVFAQSTPLQTIPLLTNQPPLRLVETQVEPLAAVDSLNQVVFASRDATGPGVVYTQSTDAGLTWNPLVGPVTTSSLIREVSILLTADPSGNPLATSMEYVAGGLSAPGFTFGNLLTTSSPPPVPIAEDIYAHGSIDGLSSGIARATGGQLYTVEALYNSTTYEVDSLVLMGNDPASTAPAKDWSIKQKWDVVDSIPFLSPKISFAPDGINGWIVALSNLQGIGADSNLTPVVWQTTDAGITWAGPQEVDFSQWQCLQDSIFAPTWPPQLTTSFEFDLTVDQNGNPHILTALMTRPPGNAFTVQPGAGKFVVDFTTPDQGLSWRSLRIDRLNTFRGEIGNSNQLYTFEHSFQIGRNPAGNRIFYLWTDTDTTGILLPNWSTNDSPNLITAGYSVSDSTAAPPKNWTLNDPNLGGKAHFPHLAPEVLLDTAGADTHVLPVTISYFTSLNLPFIGDRLYLPEIRIPESDFGSVFSMAGASTCAHACMDSTCVWPGDMDYNLLVDMDDLLMFGVNFNSTGPVRLNPSFNWVPQPGYVWPNSTAGVNLMHSDASGNGHIFWPDTMAIQQNYSLTHWKTNGLQAGAAVAGAPDLSLVPLFDSLQIGQSGTIEIHLGDSVNPADSIYGLRLAFLYDPALIDTNSVHVSFHPSWLGTPGTDLIGLYQDFYHQGRTDIGLVRTDQQERQGYGAIAKISIVAIDNISGKQLLKSDTLHTDLSNVRAVDLRLVERPLNPVGATSIIWDPTIANDFSSPLNRKVSIWPNPTRNRLHVQWNREVDAQIQVVDFTGRVVRTQAIQDGNQAILETSTLPAGMYFIRFEAGEWTDIQKVMVRP